MTTPLYAEREAFNKLHLHMEGPPSFRTWSKWNSCEERAAWEAWQARSHLASPASPVTDADVDAAIVNSGMQLPIPASRQHYRRALEAFAASKASQSDDLDHARAVVRSCGISMVSRDFIERFADFVHDWKKGDFILPRYAELDMQGCFDAWQKFDPDLATPQQASQTVEPACVNIPAWLPRRVVCEFGFANDSDTRLCIYCGKAKSQTAQPAQPARPYDQTALELCEICGWKTLIPDDCCLNCERNKATAAQPAAVRKCIIADVECKSQCGPLKCKNGKDGVYIEPQTAQPATSGEVTDACPEILSRSEQNAVLKDLAGIGCLINRHDCWIVEAEAMDMDECVPNHEKRLAELLSIGRSIITSDPGCWTDADRESFKLRHSELGASQKGDQS